MRAAALVLVAVAVTACSHRSGTSLDVVLGVFGLYRGRRIAVEGRCAFARRWIEALLGFYTPPRERRR